MLNKNIISLILGMIFGYILMKITMNIITYHGMNSNDIRTKIFEKDGIKYKFIPRVISNNK